MNRPAISAAPHADVIVVGAGIAGLTVALALADRGHCVRLVHAARFGAASRASAGLLAPSLDGLPSSLLTLARAARDFYPGYAASLEERTGVCVRLDLGGIIELGDERALREALLRNDDARSLDQAELADLEPLLSSHEAAVMHPLDGSVDAVALMRALVRAVEDHACITPSEDLAVALEMRGGLLSVRSAVGISFSAPRVVLAMGAWSDLSGHATRLPLRPVLGELLTLESPLLRHAVSAPGGYLVPGAGTVLVGATSEDAGFEVRTSSAGHAALRGFAHRVAPDLATARLRNHWSGLRPITPDGLPLLGPDSRTPGLFHATGYSRNGILLAPWAAWQLAELMTGDRSGSDTTSPIDWMAPFSPGRFTA